MSENLLDELTVGHAPTSIITVMGVGGAGGNAVNHMWDMGIEGVNFLVCNTDQQALDKSSVENKLCLGRTGLGAGNDPEMGRRSTIESLEEVRRRLESLNTEMLFITAGMGGGTGTGASPVLAKLAREMGILTVGIVTSPLQCEGNYRYCQAMAGIEELRTSVDSLLVLNNENILELYGNLPVMEAFSKADDILCSAAKGIAEIITKVSYPVNIDFADVSKVMKNSGRTHMSVVSINGSNRANEVAMMALGSPLLDNNCIRGAKNILLQFSTSSIKDLTLAEITQVQKVIQAHASMSGEIGGSLSANIIWGTSEKPSLEDGYLELVLVATGLEIENKEEASTITSELASDQCSKSPLEPATKLQGVDVKPQSAIATSTVLPPSMSNNPHQRQVILNERISRYRNIASLLEKPAYKSRASKFITDAPSGRSQVIKQPDMEHRGDSDGENDNLLFPQK